MLRLRPTHRSGLRLFFLLCGAFVLLSACATVPEEQDWIKIGQTTREEVVEQYGQPDFVMASDEGDTVIYRPRDQKQAPPQMQIPTVQAGPLGTATTRMEPVNPGLGNKPANGRRERPAQELRIRYDARGIVQEVIR